MKKKKKKNPMMNLITSKTQGKNTHTHTHKNLKDRSLGIVHRLLPEV